jgi:hypothetical protein
LLVREPEARQLYHLPYEQMSSPSVTKELDIYLKPEIHHEED